MRFSEGSNTKSRNSLHHPVIFRKSDGDAPVKRLKKLERWACDENPSWEAISWMVLSVLSRSFILPSKVESMIDLGD